MRNSYLLNLAQTSTQYREGGCTISKWNAISFYGISF